MLYLRLLNTSTEKVEVIVPENKVSDVEKIIRDSGRKVRARSTSNGLDSYHYRSIKVKIIVNGKMYSRGCSMFNYLQGDPWEGDGTINAVGISSSDTFIFSNKTRRLRRIYKNKLKRIRVAEGNGVLTYNIIRK